MLWYHNTMASNGNPLKDEKRNQPSTLVMYLCLFPLCILCVSLSLCLWLFCMLKISFDNITWVQKYKLNFYLNLNLNFEMLVVTQKNICPLTKYERDCVSNSQCRNIKGNGHSSVVWLNHDLKMKMILILIYLHVYKILFSDK